MYYNYYAYSVSAIIGLCLIIQELMLEALLIIKIIVIGNKAKNHSEKKRDKNIEKMGQKPGYIRIHNAYHFLLEVNSIFLHFHLAVEYRIDLRSNSDHAALSIMYPCLCLSKVFSLV